MLCICQRTLSYSTRSLPYDSGGDCQHFSRTVLEVPKPLTIPWPGTFPGRLICDEGNRHGYRIIIRQSGCILLAEYGKYSDLSEY